MLAVTPTGLAMRLALPSRLYTYNAFHLYNLPWQALLLCPFTDEETETQEFSKLHKVTELISIRASFEIQVVWIQRLSNSALPSPPTCLKTQV